MYQAGNGIFNQFDKVLVLAEGREIYYGPASEAKAYFENMGFICTPGANIGDFLTAVAVHTERQIAEGYEDRVPNTAAEFEDAYQQSSLRARMMEEMDSKSSDTLNWEVQKLKSERDAEKNRSLPWLSRENSPYQASFGQQVFQCTLR